jgi:NADPH-dependent glutamate synthase beta subunit-like oxidoreductase
MEAGHFIIIFGGAVAGSEAAAELSKRGIHVVVIDQFALPYGKIEAGLPKWHDKLRDRQEELINDKLTMPLVSFIPNMKLGRDIDLQRMIADWPFSAILLATGAWRDRPLPLPGIDQYIGRGFHYQNPLVNWFNNNHDPGYKGEQLSIPDGAVIIGGGLASIDVAKIAILETTRQALLQRKIVADILLMERKGVHEYLQQFGLSWEALGLKGCTLFTRGEIGDMPLNVIAEDAAETDIEKAQQVRARIVRNLQEKFPINIQSNRQAVGILTKDGRLDGLRLAATTPSNGRYVNVPGSEQDIHSPLVISAIGSVPEQVPGLRLKGEIYDVEDEQSGKIRGYENVFALGNAVTGRGNIRQSQLHSRQVSENIVDQYLAWQEEDYQEIFESASQRADSRVSVITQQIAQQRPLSATEIERIYQRIRELQEKVGYHGDYRRWIREHLPARLHSAGN